MLIVLNEDASSVPEAEEPGALTTDALDDDIKMPFWVL